jgi:hypothetical protein
MANENELIHGRVGFVRADVIRVIEEESYEASETNVNAVLEGINADFLEETMAEAGWDLIRDTVREVLAGNTEVR